jgi:metalloendopeptidase OMA1, mitochondrial
MRLVTMMSFGTQLWAGLARWKSAAFYPTPAALAPAKRLVLVGTLLAGTTACQGLNVFSLTDDSVLGSEAYVQIIDGQSTITSGPEFEMVQRLTANLVEAARFYDPETVGAFEWQVTLINDPGTVNAFALPGGKMAVYTGILPVSEGESGLAVVMGHEIAHAVWRHGTQALTRQSLQSNAIELLAALAGGDGGQLEQLAKSVANTLITLRYGRNAELQADEKGLFYMARAGYDPREAPDFWRRMSALGSSDTPEWLSTHPSNERRVEQLEALLEQAIPVFEAAHGSKPH